MSTQPAEKPWWKTFLTPGWVIAALLIVAFSYFALSTLAPWQLGKNERLEQRNEHILEAFDHDPVPLAKVVGADGALNPDDEWMRVTATGRYVGNDVLLRLRPVDRTPAFQVLRPFELETGEILMVNRGWVPAEASTKVPDFAPAPDATVTLTGMLRADEGVHPSAPRFDQGYEMVHSINPAQAAELAGVPNQPVISPYLQLLSGEPGVLTAIPLPQLETGNHLSYGLQWIAFGLLAPAGLIYFIAAETRERRRFREEQEQMRDSATLAAPAADPEPAGRAATAGAPAAAARASARERTRYGQGRRNPWASAYDKEQDRS